jgi:hypothetical protein
MKTKVSKDAAYAASPGVVVRKVEDTIILFPFAAGEDDTENEPYTLNATGKLIWRRLDGRRKIQDIAKDMASEFQTPVGVVQRDIISFVKELLERRLLVRVSVI